MVAVAIVLTGGRLYLRWRSSASSWDDAFNVLALLCLIGYYALPFEGNDTMDPSFLKEQVASEMLLWAVLWCVKASFLALCWNIFKVSPTFRKIWWLVTVYTFLTFWPLFLSNFWQCGPPSEYANATVCLAFTATAEGKTTNITIWIMNIVFHLSTELLILALPLSFISQLRMSKTQKINAAAVFCVTILTIGIGTLRNVALCIYLVSDAKYWIKISDIASVFEPTVAVVVCSLPPYKALLHKFQKRGLDLTGPLKQNVAAQADGLEADPGAKNGRRGRVVLDSITELERRAVM